MAASTISYSLLKHISGGLYRMRLHCLTCSATRLARCKINGSCISNPVYRLASNDASKTESTTLKKLNTPVGKWDKSEKHPHAEQEPLEAFPDDVNPATGEKGGPRGLEPTRYGDWERKGRCIDF